MNSQIKSYRICLIRILLLLFVCVLFQKCYADDEICKTTPASALLQAAGFSPACVATAIGACHDEVFYNDLKNAVQELKKSIEKHENNPRNCMDVLIQGKVNSGVEKIYPYKCCPDIPVLVYCDQQTEDGGWTVIQRREVLPIRENFYRSWHEYRFGFGNLTGEFWLGKDLIHELTSQSSQKLRIDLTNFEQESKVASYEYFHIEDNSASFKLSVGGYSGTANDGFASHHNGQLFSTRDRENDNHKDNCAQR